jgi:puromycin-sensitive aminopeptidase
MARLPSHITPTRYSLTIRPDLQAWTFVAEEKISLQVGKASRNLTLHSKDLEIISGFLESGTGKTKQRVEISKISYNDTAETATLSFSGPISTGAGKLHLHFRGVISEQLRGFYKSQYQHKGQTKHLVATQFEATDARRAFPCFDEPAHKAIFEVSVVIPNHLTAISNTIETPTPKGVEHDPGYKVVRFKPTPKMSSYLLAYIIGEFDSLQAKTKHGVTIRVFTTKGKKQQAKFALQVAVRSLEFLNTYFAIPYSLPVLDLIAVPDFSSGAMENWGAVTFRESALLLDENNSAFANKQRVAEVVAHELVHQWFGNLVTMEWWTQLWLNESFAALMSYVVLDDLFPEWKIWTRFAMYDHANALRLDSLKNTHPVEVEVHHPSQISEIFDAISYDKGASVLRMLMHYIGETDFRDGLRLYLKKHSYKNTASVHLWEAFEQVSGKPVGKFMRHWVGKPGYPILKIAEKSGGQLEISQHRFSLTKIKDSTVWPVPLQFMFCAKQQSELYLLDKAKKRITVPQVAEFHKANPGEIGFYRTLYSPSLLAELYQPVFNRAIDSTDRLGIIRDLFSASKAGFVSTAAYLEFLPAYANEDSYTVWAEIISGMQEIYNLLAEQPRLQNELAACFRALLKNVAKKVAWTADHKESHSRKLLRGLVLSSLGLFGDESTIKRARQLFVNRTKQPIDPDIRATVYQLANLTATKAQFKSLAQAYQAETLQEEQRRLGLAIVSNRNPNLLREALDWTLSKAVRGQDAPLLLAQALSQPTQRGQTWQWLKKNWPQLMKRYHNDQLLAYPIQYLNGFTSLQKAKEIKNFFKANPAPSVARKIKQSIEQINIQTAWLKRDQTSIKQALKSLPNS